MPGGKNRFLDSSHDPISNTATKTKGPFSEFFLKKGECLLFPKADVRNAEIEEI